MSSLRAIAIHLPQFHAIPENDTWWGKGFTEWTKVKKATPIFKGHYQPHIPLDQNYYDLKKNEALCKQAELARKFGIHGFCFYHYWFSGKKMLEQPTERMLELGKPDFPFMFCWANENWTKAWAGYDNKVLMEQTYSEEDDYCHFEYLIPFFKDHRYIKIDDKPVFIIYRSDLIPDINARTHRWRQIVKSHGIKDLYLITVERYVLGHDPSGMGFDASMEFHPHSSLYPERIKNDLFWKIFRKLDLQPRISKSRIYRFSDYVKNAIKHVNNVSYKRFPGLMPSWDNTPRREKGGLVFLDSTPKLYSRWLEHIVDNFRPYSPQENLLFINAWNEWGEGNHLEPCEKWRQSYLEETKELLKG